MRGMQLFLLRLFVGVCVFLQCVQGMQYDDLLPHEDDSSRLVACLQRLQLKHVGSIGMSDLAMQPKDEEPVGLCVENIVRKSPRILPALGNIFFSFYGFPEDIKQSLQVAGIPLKRLSPLDQLGQTVFPVYLSYYDRLLLFAISGACIGRATFEFQDIDMHLSGLRVYSEFYRRGFGVVLLDCALQIAKVHKKKSVSLLAYTLDTAHMSHEQLIDFYTSFGFGVTHGTMMQLWIEK